MIRRYAHLACSRLLDGLDGLEGRLVAGVAVDSRRAAAADAGVLDACLRVQLPSLDLSQWDLELFRDNLAQYRVSARALIRHSGRDRRHAVFVQRDCHRADSAGRRPLHQRDTAPDVFRLGFLITGIFQRLFQGLVGFNITVLLARRINVAVVHEILLAEFDRVHAKFLATRSIWLSLAKNPWGSPGERI